jgi:5'-nucleotidase
MDLATNLYGYDVVLGDHTNVPVSTFVNGALVVENKSFGATYAKVTLKVDPQNGEIGARSAMFVNPLADAVTPKQEVVDLLAPWRAELSLKLDGKIATAEGMFVRGNNVERLGEVPIGNLIADAMRTTYGTQLAFLNGGGIRASLPSSYAPADTAMRRAAPGYAAGPPYDLVSGDVYTVLPFGNSVVTRNVTGAQLWAALEHGVEAMPNAAGFFPQISGFSFRFDPSKAVGSRVVDVRLDGGTPIAKDSTVYTLTTVDFLDAGGDGYTMLAGTNNGSVSRDKMAALVEAYIKAQGSITPTTTGRIVNVMGP